MFAGGLLAIWIAVSAMGKMWIYRMLETKLCDISILLSGILLLGAGAACLLLSGHRRASIAAGAVAGSVLAITFFYGLLSGAMPCSGAF